MPDQPLPLNPNHKPTPEETAQAYKDLKTQSDLESMLAEIEKLKGGKEVLGPDGTPIKSPAERQQALQKAMENYRRQKIASLQKRLEETTNRSPEFADCLSLLREAHCLINLAFSDMSTIEGVDDELMGFANEFMSHVVRSDPNDQLDDLIRRMKHNVMVFLNKRRFFYEKLRVRRKPAVMELVNLNPNHAPLVLLDCLKDLGLPVPMAAMGSVFTLFSEGFEFEEQAAVMSYERLKARGYHSILLSSKLQGEESIAEKWWEGSCDGEKTLDGTLDPILKTRPKTQILIVASLDRMLGEEKRKDTSPKGRQQALLRIVRWCMNNQVLGLVFSEGTAETRPWMGRSFTLKKGAADVDGDSVRKRGEQEVVEPGPDRGGQAPQGPGEDQG